MSSLIAALSGGDRRSIGRADDVVRQILAKPELVPELIAGLFHTDAVVRMRCADVAEKVSASHPEWFQIFASDLLNLGASSPQKDVRWHCAQILPRLEWSLAERSALLRLLYRYCEDESRIVRACALQALADMARRDADLQERLLPVLEHATREEAPAVRARARKLLAGLRT